MQSISGFITYPCFQPQRKCLPKTWLVASLQINFYAVNHSSYTSVKQGSPSSNTTTYNMLPSLLDANHSKSELSDNFARHVYKCRY